MEEDHRPGGEGLDAWERVLGKVPCAAPRLPVLQMDVLTYGPVTEVRQRGE